MSPEPTRKTLVKALEQIADAFQLRVEDRVPGKCVTVQWPADVSDVKVFEKEAVRALEYLANKT